MARMRVVIVGGGPGGYEAALVAAESGAEVALVTNDGLGGNSVLWDSVPSKALVACAGANVWPQTAHRLGVRPAQEPAGGLPAVDMGAVTDRIRGLAENQSRDIHARVADAGVRLVTGTARLSGRESVVVDHADGSAGPTRLTGNIVLLATGSHPRVLEFSRPDGERVFTSRELHRLRTLPERLLVVGSGATGAEYAHAFARLGSDVHLVSSRDQVLPGEDADAAAVVEASFRRWGMTIHRQRRAVDLQRGRDGIRVRLRPARPSGEVAGGEDEWLEGTHALFCIGQVPASEALQAQASGITVDEHGSIPVDGVSRTNLPTVYAAGDVTSGIMLASAAAMQGRTAMWHALGRMVAPLRAEQIAATVFTEPEVARVGITPAEVGAAEAPVDTVTLSLSGNPRAKMTDNTEGFVRIHALRGSGTVVGAAVVAAYASELVTALSVAVSHRLTVSQLAHTFTIYPSMAGTLQEAARILMARQSASGPR